MSKGGGLVTLSGYDSDLYRLRTNQLVAPLGISYGKATYTEGGGVFIKAHPISQNITSKITFDGGLVVLLLNTEPDVKNTIVAETDLLSDTVGIAQERGQGRALFWGDDWISYWADPPEEPLKALWRNILNWFAHLTK
jgi:hypothetical protein